MCLGLLLTAAAACSPGTPGPEPRSSAAASAASAPSAPSAGAVVELVSGVSIGPVRVGMTRAELDGLGLPTKRGSIPAEILVGPYVATFDGDRVGSVQVALDELPGAVRVGGAVFDRTAKTAAIIAKLQGCSPPESNIGATVTACEGGRTLVIAGGPPGLPSLAVQSAERAAKAGRP